MRLSEAIALGRTVVHPLPGIVLDYSGLNGCALGMGYKANNGEVNVHPLDVSVGLEAPMQMWPWLEQAHHAIPCRCNIVCGLNAAQIIAHLFDYHVMGSDRGLLECEAVAMPWTLEQVIDWIAFVEPAEPAIEAQSELSKRVEADREMRAVEFGAGE